MSCWSQKKFSEYEFDEQNFDVEENSKWKPPQSHKKKSRFTDSSVDNYTFLHAFAGGMESEGKKPKSVIVLEVDEAVKERISRSDAALQSSSSIYNVNSLSRSRCPDVGTSYPVESFINPVPVKAATDKKDSCRTQQLNMDDDIVSISDDDTDSSSTMSSNDLADAEGSSGERMLEHDTTSPDTESCVVLYPKFVTYGKNCYRKAQLTFYSSVISLSVTEEGAKGCLTFEWKTLDLISIESQWLDRFVTAEGCLRIKDPKLASSDQKSGILEVTFTISDPHWTNTQDRIKVLDEQYKEKWDVDLDSYESFEDIVYLEGECGSISISKSDFQLLLPEKFINDTIVDFYIEYLKMIKPADARVHFFNSFFFRKLEDLDENQSQSFDPEAAFQRVRKWTKKVNIFQKDYIFIPVNFRLHWSLIVVCHPGEVTNFADEELASSLKVPCILHMDSIRGSHRGLESRIKSYLLEEWKERNTDAAEDISTKFMNLRYLRLEVPQQQNSYDCALFMLHYMELFVKQPPIDFNPLTSFISKDWFHPIEASLKRARIKRLIFELAKSNAESPRPNGKSSYELKDEDEEEADVGILHETRNSKEIYFENLCDSVPRMVTPLRSEPYDSPIMVTPLRSEPYFDCDMDIQEIQSDCEVSPDRADNGGSFFAENDRKHGQLVTYDPSINVL